jgi:hypothetical protein
VDVVVVFRFADITDPDSDAADAAIQNLEVDLTEAGIDCDEWYIDDACDTDHDRDTTEGP